MLLPTGATDITGWTVIGGGLAWDGTANPYNLTASDGNYFLDLTGDFDSAPYGGVQQTVATTIGQNYQLSFDVGTSTTYDSDEGSVPLIAVSIQTTAGSSSDLVTTTIPDSINEWQPFSFDFTATSASSTISLVGQASENIQYIGLDNVDLEAVPEPGTLTLLASSGLLVLVSCRRFRKA
jgi:hypothetical protein